MTKKITITVAVDTGDPFCKELPLTLSAPATVTQVLDTYCQTYMLSRDALQGDTGIFGKPVSGEQLVQHGDRVELYAPLRIDPKEARRRRAERRQLGSTQTKRT